MLKGDGYLDVLTRTGRSHPPTVHSSIVFARYIHILRSTSHVGKRDWSRLPENITHVESSEMPTKCHVGLADFGRPHVAPNKRVQADKDAWRTQI